MYDTFEAVAPPVAGLRMMRRHAWLLGSNVGFVAALKHASYTAAPGSTAIMSSISISYQSSVPEKPSRSALPVFGCQTKPAVRVVASSGLTLGLPTALTNHSALAGLNAGARRTTPRC
jgi:hypothetical protein